MVADDPELLLDRARASEVGLRLSDRRAALDEVETLLSDGEVRAAPPGRDWELELAAERAIDLAHHNELARARALAEQILADAATRADMAFARATEALGRALAWSGTDGDSRRARHVLEDAIKLYEKLDDVERQGYTMFWLANCVDFQNGRLHEAIEQTRRALELLPVTSTRRATVLSFYGDMLITAGSWTQAAQVLEQGAQLAAAGGPEMRMQRAYTAWSTARLASARGDAGATERWIAETERDPGDWFEMQTGVTFLADAAEMLDRVGRSARAEQYLQRALARGPDDEFVQQARAALLARRGDPDQALQALAALVRGAWLEKRLVWRHTLLGAYATLRAGRLGAGELAAQALVEAVAAGGVEIAASGEREIVRALLPLAEAAGSLPARELLAPAGRYVVRLFGAMRVSRGDADVPVPPGQAGELVRMLAVHPHGRGVDEVLDSFYGELDRSTARHRLRQTLSRLRAAAGELVVRDGDLLRLAPAWVDVLAFREACDRALSASGPVRAELAHSALALRTGPPLPADPYAGWASAPREQVERRYLALLDVVADDAQRRGSYDEALRALATARDEDPYDESRYVRAADILVRSGRRGAAVHIARRAARALADIAVPVPAALRALLTDPP